MKIVRKMALLILIVVNMFSFYKLNSNKFSFHYIFKPSCQISSLKDIEYCYKNNNNIAIEKTKIYKTGYQYIDPNYIFIDIDISGKSLIGLINRKNLTSSKLYGHLMEPNDILFKEILTKIKNNYQSKMQIQNIDNLFIPLVLNSYNYKNTNIINLIYGLIFILSILLIIYLSINLIKEEKYEE